MAVLYRPLLLSSVSYELAAARGVPVRLVGIGYLAALAMAVSLSAVTIGAILSTALLIGPAAVALRLVKRTGMAIVAAAAIGVVASWLGNLLAYDSRDWSGRTSWPVSFCIVAVIFVLYFASRCPSLHPRSGPPRLATPSPITRPAHLMFANFMINAWEVATIVAVVAGIVGFFTVLRGPPSPLTRCPTGPSRERPAPASSV